MFGKGVGQDEGLFSDSSSTLGYKVEITTPVDANVGHGRVVPFAGHANSGYD